MRGGLNVVAERIQQAVDRVNAGELEAALAIYERVFDPLPDGRGFQVPPALQLEFVYRRVDLLRRLGRAAAALALLDGDDVIAWAAEPAQAIERHLQRGDVLVAAPDLQPALHAYSDALRVVDDQLEGSSEARVAVITRMLNGVRDRDEPAVLLQTARDLIAWGQHIDDGMAVMAASWFIPYAYRGLGEKEKAREHASLILARAREAQHEEYIAEWEQFLASLD
jgi:tetratricopeptide (TPR) repeat protein